MRHTLLPLALLIAACQPADRPAPASEASAPATDAGAMAGDATEPDATQDLDSRREGAAPAAAGAGAEAPAASPTLPPAALAALRADIGADMGEVRVFGRAIDLDGDGREEVVAQLVGPMLCGTGGCNTYVLSPDGDAWRIVGNLSVTQAPVAAAQTRSHGWRDLVLAVGGGGGQSGFVTVPFDGKAYAKRGAGTAPARELPAAADIVVPRFESMDEGAPLP